MTLNTTLGSIGWNANHGVCIQDFETTILPYLTASHLWGTLNFSAPWNRVTYIYDTAIGDNPNVIESFLARPGSPEHALFSTLRDFIQSGIVQCLIRDKIQIGGEIVTTYPTVSSLYDAWMKRDGNTTGNFLTQRFGNDRTNYNRSFDQLLSDYPGAVKYYDPNIAKPLFRTTIRDGLSAGQALLGLVEQLPADVAFEYRRMCAEKEYMTTVDLWNLVRPYARSDEAARQLLIMQGYVNQHSIAQSVSAGISGSDWGHSWRPSPSAEDPPAAMTPTDVFDQADLSLSAPAIELLSRLP